MADWGSSIGAAASRERRGAPKSSDQQSKAELLQAIAARRQAQLLRSNRAPSPPEGVVPSQKDAHFHLEARMAASKLLPESSEASGTSGDEESDHARHANPSSSSGASQSKSQLGGRRKLGRPQLESKHLSDDDHDLEWAHGNGNMSSKASPPDDLSNVLSNMSIKEKNGGQNQSQWKAKDSIMDMRKRLVKKSTVVDLEDDSEGDTFVSPGAGASSPSGDYTSADDGDVDSPVVSKVKSKINQANQPPKLTSLASRPRSDCFSEDDEENVFDLQIKSRAKESVSAVAVASKPQPPPAAQATKEGEKTGEGGDLVLVEGRNRFVLRAKVATMLYPHQRAGIQWLWGLHTKGMGGILGDDMGLGKTMQNIKCALIVAPKTLIAHWVKELKVVGLSRKTQDYSGTSVKVRECALHHVLQMGGVLLTTYDMVRCNYKALRGDFAGRDGYGDTSDDIVTWDYLILDEGHLVKNPNTQRAKSLREIPAAHRIVLSGTPLQNHLQEMWALFDFCCPNLLGDRKEFREKYECQILAGTDKHASDRQMRIGLAVAEELRQKFKPFFLRRLKSEVFPASDKEDRKLSRKNDLIVWLRLSERQQKLYRAFLNSDTAEETWKTGSGVLAALTVMKKICDHPSLLTTRAATDIAEGMEGYLDNTDIAAAEAMTRSLAGMVDEDGDMGSPSCKIVFLMALLENLVEQGHRTLIFAQTRKMLNMIQEEIMQRGWCYRRIDGTIKAADREQCVQEFQNDDEIPLFLLTSQVGGLGLTLTGADRVVIVDPAWNPSTDNQSVDRAYRIGQKNDVVVYRLMTCGTIEEKIYRKQVFKGHLMKVATEKKNQMRYFSGQELGEMFRVPESGFDVSLTQQQLHKEHFSQHKIDEGLQQHIEFLDGLGIAGVSHHDLLFTKEAEPLPPPGPEEHDLKATWEPRNPSFVGQRFKPASKNETHVWEASQTLGRGVLASAAAGLQARSQHDDHWLKVQFLRIKLERLFTTLDDKAMLARLPDRGANIEKKIQETMAELKEAELKAASKENFGAQARPAAPPAFVDLTPASTTTLMWPEPETRPKPLGSNSIKPAGMSGAPIKRSAYPQLQQASVKPTNAMPSYLVAAQAVNATKPKPANDMPSWSLLSDSPSSSRNSPAPTSTADVDHMSEALSSLQLRLH